MSDIEINEINALLQKTILENKLSKEEFTNIINQVTNVTTNHNSLINDLKHELFIMIHNHEQNEKLFKEKNEEIESLKAELNKFQIASAHINNILRATEQLSNLCQENSEMYLKHKIDSDTKLAAQQELIQKQQEEINNLQKISIISISGDYIAIMDAKQPKISFCTRVMNMFKC
jgi:hypothetical protein